MNDFTWINAHLHEDAAALRLKYGHARDCDILQIECRQRFATKLAATLASDPHFVFPSLLAGEQATSDALARYHASLIPSGATVADLTAGLGIDAIAMAGRSGHVVAVEPDDVTADVLRYNTSRYPQIDVVHGDCRQFVSDAVEASRHFDVMFIDPARRDSAGGRTFALDDCTPDVTGMLPMLRQVCDMLVVKASPMLDIAHTIARLPGTARIIVLGTTLECKELDAVVDFAAHDNPDIDAVTVCPDGYSIFNFTRDGEASAEASFGIPGPGQYVLDPYPAVMKAAPFKTLCHRYGLMKPAANTHLWFGDTIPDSFPGRSYLVDEVIEYASKHIKRYAPRHPRVGVTVRNFGLQAKDLRLRLGVRDGSGRLFAVTGVVGRRWLITTEPPIPCKKD